MGDLLSRALKEVAFFSRTRKTSQDNFEIASEQSLAELAPPLAVCPLPRWIGSPKIPVRLGPMAKKIAESADNQAAQPQ
jgi:hypothetical protein